MKRRNLLGTALLALLVVATIWERFYHVPVDRGPWSPDQERVIGGRWHGDTLLVSNVRDADPRSHVPRWSDEDYDLAKLDSVWLIVAPFSEGWRGPAHVFVTFGFGGERYLALSVEARRGPGIEYSVLGGLFDQYQVIYIAGTERDLIGRRAAEAEGPVYMYPIRATPAALRTLLTNMVDHGEWLGRRPQFYNTLTNNCTSNLLMHVEPLVPMRIHSGLLSVMPGYADKVAKDLDLIADSADLATERQRYRIDARARAALDSADFSSLIRRAS